MAAGMKRINTPGVLTYRTPSFTGGDEVYIAQVYPWGGVSCTCPDYVYRRKEVGGRCKHIREAVALSREEEVSH